MDLHCFDLRFLAELIYEEVIDWEERNKNGLMKEDCSGIFSINCSIKEQINCRKKHLTSDPLDPLYVCLSDQMWCRAQPPSRHRPTTSRLCPQNKPWPPTQTAAALTHWRDRWMSVSEHLDQLIYIQINHHLLHYLFVISWFCASMLSSHPWRIGLFFYLLYFCDLANPFSTAGCVRQLPARHI